MTFFLANALHRVPVFWAVSLINRMGTHVSTQGAAESTAASQDATRSDVAETQSGIDKPVEPLLLSAESESEGVPIQETALSIDQSSLQQSEQGASQRTSLTSESHTTGTESPFTGYDRHAWNNESGSRKEHSDTGEVQGPTDASPAQRRSASISVLKRICEEMSRKSTSIDRSDDFIPQSNDKEIGADCIRKNPSAFMRRLSSKLNDITIQLERFLPKEEDELMPCYLHRVFDAIDTKKSGTILVGEIIQKVFPDNEHGSIQATLSAASTTAEGHITVDQFANFFAYLSGGNCMGPELDLGAGGSDGEMRLSVAESTMDRRGRMSSVKLLYDGSAEVCLLKDEKPANLRDVRVKALPSQSERIKCIAVSPDPRIYAVSHRHDCIAHIYTNQGKEVRRLMGHRDSLLGIAFSPDRKYVATVSRDNLLVVWDCTVGLECHSVEHPGIVTAVAFAFDGKHVYTGCQDNLARKISFPKGRLRATIPDLPGAEAGVIVSVSTQHTKNDVVVFSRSCDEHAYVAQADDLSLCMQLNGHETLVWQTAFSSNDDFILTCCERKVILWRTADFSPVGFFDADMMSTTAGTATVDTCLWTTAIFGPRMYRNLVFAFNTRKEMIVLDVNNPEGSAVLDLRLRSSVYAASTSDSSNCLVCGDDLGNVYQLLMS